MFVSKDWNKIHYAGTKYECEPSFPDSKKMIKAIQMNEKQLQIHAKNVFNKIITVVLRFNTRCGSDCNRTYMANEFGQFAHCFNFSCAIVELSEITAYAKN